MSDMEGFSLADLADLDVSDIDEVRYVKLPAGVYDMRVKSADLFEDSKDGEIRYKAEFELEIVEVKSTIESTTEEDREKLIGKVHTERFFVKPAEEQDKIEAAIGRIRAFVADIGCNNAGSLGGIVRDTKDHVFTTKLIMQKDRNDKSIEYARLRLDGKVNRA